MLIDNTLILSKNPGDNAIAVWHQDGTSSGWHLTPSVTAWIALSPSNPASGCMRVIPGTHATGRLEHRRVENERSLFRNTDEIAVAVDESRALDVILRPGEFSLHHSSLVHGSGPNISPVRRTGFIIRFVTPAFQHRKTNYPMIRVSGSADCGQLPVQSTRPSATLEEGFERWRAAVPAVLPAKA